MHLGINILFMICCLLVFHTTDVRAQDYSYATRFTVSARHFVDTIPIEFEDNQIYLTARISNRTYRFCLDTGSSQGIVYADGSFPYTRKLGKITSHDANGITSKIDVVEYPDFSIGHLKIHGYTGSLLNSHINHKGYDAVLGFDLVNKGLAAKIDARQKVMILTDIPRFFDNEGGYATRYRLLRWVPNVKISPYHGCIDEARFDTGSRRLYVMSNKSRKLFEKTYEDFSSQIEGLSFGRRAIGSFGAEHSDEVAFLWLDQLSIGDYLFGDYHTMTTQGNSRIGAEILQYGSIILDPKGKKLIFQPYDDSSSCMVSNTQMDIAFVPSGTLPSVGLIWQGSQHYKNGFRQGDIILAIDGRNIFTFQQFLTYPFIEGKRHQFTVKGTDGTIRTIESER
jgi:hypothetical protein